MLTKRRLVSPVIAVARSEPQTQAALNRRNFLKASGVTGALGSAIALGGGAIRQAQAGDVVPGEPVETRKSVCTHCSVGCTVIAKVQRGVWVGQEPAFDSPINLGTHCAKGAAVRELVSGERRLKYPMKLVDGTWQRISWDQAIDELGDKLLDIRAKAGPDSVF